MREQHSRRWRETERKMESAALELMKREDLEHITIQAICEEAHVNRSTFYYHFLDVYDLFDKMEMKLRRDILKRYDPSTAKAFSFSSFIPLFKHIREHRHFYKIVLQTRNSFPIQEGFERLLNDVLRPACLRAGITDENEIMYYLVFFQAGFTICLRRWVDGGCQESEKELAGIIAACIPDSFKTAM